MINPSERALLETLQAVTMAASEADGIDLPLQKAITLICELTHFPVGHIFAPIEENQINLISTEIWHLAESERYRSFRKATELLKFSPRLGGVGQAVAKGETVWLTRLGQNPNFLRSKAAAAVGLETGVFVPVLVEERITAVLEFFTPESAPANQLLMASLFNLGTKLGLVIERKKNELRVRRSEARFRALLTSAPVGIVIIDGAGKIVMVNEAIEQMFAYKRADLIDAELEKLLPANLQAIHRQHRMMYFAQPRPRPMGVGYDLVGERKDGSHFPIEVGLSTIEAEEGLLAIGFVTDISKRKQAEAELRALNEALEERVAERTAHLTAVNKELEAFSYSVSHDLRAPLRAITGFSRALHEDYHAILDDEGQRYLELLLRESQHMNQLLADLLDLSRYTRAPINREVIDISALASSIATELERREPDRAVTFDIATGLTARGDPKLTRILLQNLLENAWKYSKYEADARIEVGHTEHNGRSLFYVRDNGVGFDPAYSHKLFGAFQRLHSSKQFEGTGIGLATVQRIVNRHGGTVGAEGATGEGATFYFSLESANHHNGGIKP